jgi:hypothetical protein
MIGTALRIPVMTLLKILATLLVALTFALLALPGFAANDNDGVTNGAPANPGDPAARPRRHHHKHQGNQQRLHRRLQPDGNTTPPPAPQGSAPGETDRG